MYQEAPKIISRGLLAALHPLPRYRAWYMDKERKKLKISILSRLICKEQFRVFINVDCWMYFYLNSSSAAPPPPFLFCFMKFSKSVIEGGTSNMHEKLYIVFFIFFYFDNNKTVSCISVMFSNPNFTSILPWSVSNLASVPLLFFSPALSSFLLFSCPPPRNYFAWGWELHYSKQYVFITRGHCEYTTTTQNSVVFMVSDS